MSIPFLLFTIFIVLAAIAGAAFLFFLGYLYWWQIARAQPQHAGELRSAIFDAPVEVLRDKHGIPHIYAQSRADLFRAQGLAHAQDRFWQMDQQRRTAQGRLAELFGEAALDADRFVRTVGIQRAAEAELAALDADTRAVLQWYTEGVNEWLRIRSGRVAAELNLLRIRPDEWRPVDSLAIAKLHAWSLSANWESELTRLRLLLAGDPYRSADLESDTPASTPIISEASGIAPERLLHGAGLVLNFMESLKPWLKPGAQAESGGAGSNAWVLAPKVSMTRRPLLANDLHMPVQIPSQWYENHLVAGEFAVTGATLPGLPAIMVGHNEEIAWGIANGYVDQQDLYIERPHADNREDAPPRFGEGDGWRDAEVREEVIRVRGRAQPHRERVVISHHGPILTNLLPKDVRTAELPLAIQWTGAEPTGSMLRSMLQVNGATTIEEATAAFSFWDTPSQSVVLTDVRGNTAWLLAGSIPVRTQGAGVLPSPGWLPEYSWSGYLDRTMTPRVMNPDVGSIVAANNKPVGDDFPYFLGMEFDPGWRAARIAELLAERERFSIRDMEEMQQDTLDKYAAELVRWMTLINTEDPWEKVSIQALRKWNFRMDVDSVPALVYHYVLIEMLALMFGDKLGAVGSPYIGNSVTPIAPFSSHSDKAQQRLLELLNNEERSFWYHDAATGEQRTRADFVHAAFTRAVRRIRDNLGDSTLRWQWGRSHQVQFAHPLGSARFLRGIFNRGPVPTGGDQNSPLQSRTAPMHPMGMVQMIPTFRQIMEVGNWETMQSVNVTGQSGHPLHPHYDNQIVMWREGVYHLNPWGREMVEKAAVERLTVMPASAA